MSFDQTHLCRDAGLAILREAHEAGYPNLTKTVLVKYFYLLDVFVAEENSGRPWTLVPWRFLHYGPYSGELAACLDLMESDALIDVESKSSKDREFALYRLNQRASPKSLVDLGVPRNAAMRLAQAIRDFTNSLPELLNYVYFSTEPMRTAKPNDQLDFSQCSKIDYKADIRPIKLKVPDRKSLTRMRDLINAISEKDKSSKVNVLPGIIKDEHLALALTVGDLEGLNPTGDLRAQLIFPG